MISNSFAPKTRLRMASRLLIMEVSIVPIFKITFFIGYCASHIYIHLYTLFYSCLCLGQYSKGHYWWATGNYSSSFYSSFSLIEFAVLYLLTPHTRNHHFQEGFRIKSHFFTCLETWTTYLLVVCRVDHLLHYLANPKNANPILLVAQESGHAAWNA